MKVLFVSAWFPYPPNNGSRIRVYNLIKQLALRHDIYLVSLLQEDSRAEDAEKLSEFCQIVSLHRSRWFKPGTLKSFLGFFSSKPRSFVDTYDAEIADAVREAISSLKPDVVVASQIGAMAYVPCNCPAPVVFEELEVGAMYRPVTTGPLRRRARAMLTFAKHRRFVADLLSRADVFTCVSAEELELVQRLIPCARPGVVVPNGVDTGYYDNRQRSPEPGALVYNGAVTYSANLDAVRYFASEVYPVLRALVPNAILRVTGSTEGVDLSGISDCPGIEFTGYVEDIRTILDRSAACVVPLRQGGGSRLKILEAMAAGVPVVSTSVGVEGLDVVDGQHLLVADSPEEFARSVHSVLTRPELASELACEAKRFVRDRYDWSVVGRSLFDVVDSAVREFKQSRSVRAQ